MSADVKKPTPPKAPKEAQLNGPPEDKHEKFKRLATRRVAKAIGQLRQIGNLGNKRNYLYTEEQAGKILAALTSEMAAIRAAFSGAPAAVETFRLE